MTMLRPAATGVVTRALDSVSVKTCLAAILSVTAWHFTDAGDIKTLKQQNVAQQSSLDFQRQELVLKVDKDAYQQDQRQLYEEIHEVRLREDQIMQTLLTEKGR